MFRRHHLLVSASAALVTSVLAVGCSDKQSATPRVTFDSTITPGTHSPAECPEKSTWLTIGSFGNPARGRTDPNDPNSPLVDPVRPIDNGGDDQQGKVDISCSVVDNGGVFDVKLSASLSGATGGAVTVEGKIGKRVDSPSVLGIFSASGRGSYTSQGSAGCVVTFDTAVGHDIAPGRVWANITCPTIQQQSQQRTCSGKAEFRFENCTQ